MKLGKLILFPGLGADGRLFNPQRVLPVEIVTPGWIPPLEGESLAAYAGKMAKHMMHAGICVPGESVHLGGASFGGMVAQELAGALLREGVKVRGVVLMASARSGREVSRTLSWVERGSRGLPDTLLEFGRRRAKLIGPEFRAVPLPMKRLLREMFLATNLDFLRWGSRAIIEWPGAGAKAEAADDAADPVQPPVPVRQIHGAEDRVIPVRHVHPDVIIPGAGHLVNITHPAEVNQFIEFSLGRMS
ncbi:MAG: alpha/beta hydrolase [Phycisphaerae bacterium]|nr:MAG: alpha/beta hydrolase [Planctomycetota bacterium]KAB2947033.1 MAG: alpha/beta hydrolase [Phycisphaerae bacterium]MBE7456866.1 alpha/beta hydrolase [Planctomycetia bacterium]MCK6464313.1 alpha/beta hydrolase [Phycisphaerae bacterium]MCL4717906.1 alpha/beta hydrolase [Phycisphaerae bacterium]